MKKLFPLSAPAASLLAGLALFFLTLLVFAPALGNGFVNYDDPGYVTENDRVRGGLTLDAMGKVFSETCLANWHPLTILSHMLDYQLYGLNPFGHHLTSILLHAGTAAILFWALQTLTGSFWRSLLVAVFFAIHPLRVESVAWISERKDVLSGLFFALTLLFYARFAKAGGGTWKQRWGNYGAAFIFCAMGLMSKPMLVTLPFVLLLLDYWPLRRIPPWGKGLREKIPFFVLMLVFSWITFAVQQGAGAVKTVSVFPFDARLGNALLSYCLYLGKMIWPFHLAAFYPHPVYQPVLLVVLSGLFLLVVTILLVKRRRHSPAMLVGWCWFLGMLVPVIGLVQIGAQSMADRYTYLPMIGILIMAVWGLPPHFFSLRRPVGMLIFVLAFVFALSLTRSQILVWKDGETLFTHAVEVTGPNPVAHMNLGLALWDKKREEQAFEEMAKAQALAPQYAEVRLNLGNMLQKKGRLKEAENELLNAATLDPTSPDIQASLGQVLAASGRPGEAVGRYSAALRFKPDFAVAHNNLGVALESLGRVDEAALHYWAAIGIRPGYFEAHLNMGSLFYKQKRFDEAMLEFGECVRLEPSSPQAWNNLAGALFAKGKWDESIGAYNEALRFKPDYQEARANLEGVLKLVLSGKKP